LAIRTFFGLPAGNSSFTDLKNKKMENNNLFPRKTKTVYLGKSEPETMKREISKEPRGLNDLKEKLAKMRSPRPFLFDPEIFPK